MYVSRFCFHSIPGKTDAVEQELKRVANMVARAGGKNIRIQRTHFASLGSPDVVFEQEAENLQDLENQIQKVTRSTDFQRSTKRMSRLLWQSPKREIYIVETRYDLDLDWKTIGRYIASGGQITTFSPLCHWTRRVWWPIWQPLFGSIRNAP